MSMRRPTRLARGWPALLLLLLLPGTAAAEAIERFQQGLLWRVEGSGAGASYIFGTIHSADPAVTALPEPVAEALATARSVTVEMASDAAVERRLAAAMLLPGDRRLGDILKPELHAAAIAAARRYGLPAAAAERLKPWALMAILSVPESERRRIDSGLPALDGLLQRTAEAAGKPVYGLETAAEQIAVFDGMALEHQIAFLAEAVAQQEAVEATFEALRRHYLARDLGAILGMIERLQAGSDPALRRLWQERLIDARNRRMAERLRPRLGEGDAFIAMGALHLPGEKGVLNLLAQAGYRLTRVY